MSRSKGDTHGKQINGEITSASGKARMGADGYFARRHEDDVGSPLAKVWAKKMVRRARRRLPINLNEAS